MSAFEYSICVEYLKIIRYELIKNRKHFKFLVLTFTKHKPYLMIYPPLQEYLEMVAREAGFEVAYIDVEGGKYTYTLKSILREV